MVTNKFKIQDLPPKNGNDLPSWLSFDDVTGTFSGTPADKMINDTLYKDVKQAA